MIRIALPVLLLLSVPLWAVDGDKPTIYDHVTPDGADLDAQVNEALGAKYTILPIKQNEAGYTDVSVTAGSLPHTARTLFGHHLGGTVLVAYVITADGHAADPVILRTTDEHLNVFALKAMKEWRFDPAKLKGVPIATTAAQEFTFQGDAPKKQEVAALPKKDDDAALPKQGDDTSPPTRTVEVSQVKQEDTAPPPPPQADDVSQAKKEQAPPPPAQAENDSPPQRGDERRGLVVDNVILYQPSDVLSLRVGVGRLAAYIRKLQAVLSAHFADADSPETLFTVVAVRPGNEVHVWFISSRQDGDDSAFDSLRKQLEAVTPLDVQEGPVAFAISAKLAGGDGKKVTTGSDSTVPLPKSWPSAAKVLNPAVLDDFLNSTWPDGK